MTPTDNYITHEKGIKSWLFTLDHKRIGLLYLYSLMAAFAMGGIMALLVRTELIAPGETIMKADQYNKAFTLHGAIMIFLFIIPSIPAVFGNFFLPIMLGAKDLAFPKMNLLSYYLYLFGALFAIGAITGGGVDTGWTFYTPYSTDSNTTVIPLVFGVFILGFSSILTGLNFIVTIHKMRPPGMGWFDMPLFLWSLYATSIIQVLATPILGITVMLLIVEKYFGIGFFDPNLGGDPILFQHFFWFYSHPAVYIMILPGMGIISELVPVFSRKPIFGYKAIAYSGVAIAVLGFLVWGHHMFVSGQSELASFIFSMITFSVAVPSAIKIFNWLATMYKGSISLDTPMCYALSFILLFLIGGLTGVVLGVLAIDIHLHDTYFVVAHFHYTIMGGAVIAFLGGLHYWWPKMFGRMYSEFWGRLVCLGIFIGFNMTFFTQFVLGSKGMPRRYYDYIEEFTTYHQISTIGAYIMALSFLTMAVYLIHSVIKGKKAVANPWGGVTLEWRCSSPPPHDNFKKPPQNVGNPYDYSDLELDEATGNYSVKRDK